MVCQKRPPDRPQVCVGCRARYAGYLRDIPTLVADLAGELAGNTSAGRQGRVSGTPEAPVPLSLDVLDLIGPARPGSLLPHANGLLHQTAAIVTRTRSLERHEYAARWTDQIGDLSVATQLDAWVRDWREQRGRGEGPPEPTVPVLARWLADRWEDACDNHPAVDEFALDVGELRGRLRAVAGLVEPREQQCVGVACPSCDLRTLWRLPLNDGTMSDYVECKVCGHLLMPSEYERWVGQLAAWEKGPR